MREIYLNITYECNSNCVFCAAEHEIIGQCGNINFHEIVSIFNKIELHEGDEVIINGGEPTIHKELIDIIKYVKSKNADVILFTNGRAFKNFNYLNQILKNGITQISIPIHGTEIIHDKITRVKGSYRETLRGIKNIKKLKKGSKTSIELKVVLCKSNIETIPKVIEKILQLDVADRILISTLFQTEVAKRNGEIVLPNESIVVVSDILNVIRTSTYRGNVILYGMPICMLKDEDVEFLIKRMERNSKFVSEHFEEIYVDYTKRGEYIKDSDRSKCLIKYCKYRNYCEIGDVDNYKMYSKLLNPFI